SVAGVGNNSQFFQTILGNIGDSGTTINGIGTGCVFYNCNILGGTTASIGNGSNVTVVCKYTYIELAWATTVTISKGDLISTNAASETIDPKIETYIFTGTTATWTMYRVGASV